MPLAVPSVLCGSPSLGACTQGKGGDVVAAAETMGAGVRIGGSCGCVERAGGGGQSQRPTPFAEGCHRLRDGGGHGGASGSPPPPPSGAVRCALQSAGGGWLSPGWRRITGPGGMDCPPLHPPTQSVCGRRGWGGHGLGAQGVGGTGESGIWNLADPPEALAQPEGDPENVGRLTAKGRCTRSRQVGSKRAAGGGTPRQGDLRRPCFRLGGGGGVPREGVRGSPCW